MKRLWLSPPPYLETLTVNSCTYSSVLNLFNPQHSTFRLLCCACSPRAQLSLPLSLWTLSQPLATQTCGEIKYGGHLCQQPNRCEEPLGTQHTCRIWIKWKKKSWVSISSSCPRIFFELTVNNHLSLMHSVTSWLSHFGHKNNTKTS